MVGLIMLAKPVGFCLEPCRWLNVAAPLNNTTSANGQLANSVWTERTDLSTLAIPAGLLCLLLNNNQPPFILFLFIIRIGQPSICQFDLFANPLGMALIRLAAW